MTVRKLLALVLALSLIVPALAGCGGGEATTDTGGDGGAKIKAAMVTDVGGLGDKSFNELSYAGLQKAETDLGAEITALESKEQADYVSNLDQLANAGYNPIFAVGFLMTNAVSEVSTAFPDVTFGAIDIDFAPNPIPENVVPLLFKEHEAAYLAGIVAGLLTTQTDVDPRINDKLVVGFVGGMEIPPVQRFQAGFVQGVKKANPDVKVITSYTGTFTDQQKGKETALAMIEQGADIVFAAAGQTGVGSFNAAKEKNALFIGVDADQYNTLDNPGDTIITSAVKRVDTAVFETVKAAQEGTLKGGENRLFGLKEGGVGLAPYHEWESKMPQEIKDAVAKATQEVVDGTVTVSDTAQ